MSAKNTASKKFGFRNRPRQKQKNKILHGHLIKTLMRHTFECTRQLKYSWTRNLHINWNCSSKGGRAFVSWLQSANINAHIASGNHAGGFTLSFPQSFTMVHSHFTITPQHNGSGQWYLLFNYQKQIDCLSGKWWLLFN